MLAITLILDGKVKQDLICYSAGAVDLQINGALGTAFNELDAEADFDRLLRICRFLWGQGLDCFLPTLVTTSVEKVQKSLGVIQAVMEVQAEGEERSAKILGAHLEGPFLHPAKRGAHPEEFLLPLTVDRIKQLLGDRTSIVKLITLAPELDETGEVIPYLLGQRVVVSLGHSTAAAKQAKQAFEQGARMVTHAFNAMPSLHHREPGLLGEALLDERVWCGLIADGVHVHPKMVELLVRLKRQLFLVSDALAPLGLIDGQYPWDNRVIEIDAGTARLSDRTLAGTTLPLLECVKNLVRWGICEPKEAIALATDAPRHALNLPIPFGNAAKSLMWYWQDEELAWSRRSDFG
jgi:N-acetylglucosamine-6-phosphate deacetylase